MNVYSRYLLVVLLILSNFVFVLPSYSIGADYYFSDSKKPTLSYNLDFNIFSNKSYSDDDNVFYTRVLLKFFPEYSPLINRLDTSLNKTQDFGGFVGLGLGYTYKIAGNEYSFLKMKLTPLVEAKQYVHSVKQSNGTESNAFARLFFLGGKVSFVFNNFIDLSFRGDWGTSFDKLNVVNFESELGVIISSLSLSVKGGVESFPDFLGNTFSAYKLGLNIGLR